MRGYQAAIKGVHVWKYTPQSRWPTTNRVVGHEVARVVRVRVERHGACWRVAMVVGQATTVECWREGEEAVSLFKGCRTAFRTPLGTAVCRRAGRRRTLSVGAGREAKYCGAL